LPTKSDNPINTAKDNTTLYFKMIRDYCNLPIEYGMHSSNNVVNREMIQEKIREALGLEKEALKAVNESDSRVY
jgi:hypothetical protein